MSVYTPYPSYGVRIFPLIGVLGVFIHVLLLVCIFHIYFESPLIPNLRGHAPDWKSQPPADRVVLIVADGLRAHTFYEHMDIQAPFLSGLLDSGVLWGVSHTHVPTESRPGHVALAAGFYEDVSAITRGWKENTVPFDSIFNRSAYSFCWGSPDIVPLFANGDHSDRVYAHSYSAELEDFASADASQLDKWVFDRVHEFFGNVTEENGTSSLNESNQELRTRFYSQGNIFFLHLLGLDTNGHGHKPHSKEYINNINVVDKGLRRLQTLFDETFGTEQRTAFVFTADHGMTDWGSHGAGTDHETMTPLMLWGTGLSKQTVGVDRTVRDWWTNNKHSQRIEQIDLAPLISTLLGHVMPTNSLGRVPLQLVSASVRYKYQAAAANFAQMREQLLARRQQRHEQTLFGRDPTDYEHLTTARLSSIQRTVQSLAGQNRWQAATELLMQELPVLRKALLYWHRYEQPTQTLCIVLIIVCWVTLLGALNAKPPNMTHVDLVPNIGWVILMALLLTIACMKHLHPLNHLLYTLPVYLLQLSVRIAWPQANWKVELNGWKPVILRYGLVAVAAVLFTQLFETRWILSVLLLVLCVNGALIASRYNPVQWTVIWVLTCVGAALFPLAPTVGKAMHPVLHLAPSIVLVLLIGGVLWHQRSYNAQKWLPMMMIGGNSQFGANPFQKLAVRQFASVWLLAAVGNILCIVISDYYLSSKQAVPVLCNLWSWICLMIAPLAGVLSVPGVQPTWRAISVCVSVYVPYALMSLAQETAFYVVYALVLAQWVYVETQLSQRTHVSSENEQWRIVLSVQCLLLFAFFGTGNLASLNSFDPSFLRCLVSTFSPWLMSVLLVWKVLVPIMVLSMAVTILYARTTHSISQLAAKTLQLADCMALVCFLQLKDSGSWLAIGMSISHYLLSVLLPLCFGALCLLTHALLHTDLNAVIAWTKQRRYTV